MSKYLVTYTLMGDLVVDSFGSEKGVLEFLKRHPDLVNEINDLQVIEIKREYSIQEFLSALVPS